MSEPNMLRALERDAADLGELPAPTDEANAPAAPRRRGRPKGVKNAGVSRARVAVWAALRKDSKRTDVAIAAELGVSRQLVASMRVSLAIKPAALRRQVRRQATGPRNPERTAAVKAARAAGRPVVAIAAALGITPARVYQLLRAA